MSKFRTRFNMTMGAFAMLFVAFLSAAITLRLALHGREVTVPNFSGMSVSEASTAALGQDLDLSIENQYYSTTVPAGRILSQAPAAGSRVRKHWPVRVTESLGPQQVTIPDVVGEMQREATMNLRRSSLDLGGTAKLDAPGDPDIVLAQSPPPAAGVDQPRVSLLLSQAEGTAGSAIVLPSFAGMSYSAASHAASALGLRLQPVTDSAGTSAPPPGAVPGPNGGYVDAAGNPVAMIVTPATPSGPINSQRPDAGSRVNAGDTVKVYFGKAGQNANLGQ